MRKRGFYAVGVAAIGVVLVLALTLNSAAAHEGEHAEVPEGFQYATEALVSAGVLTVIATSGLCYWWLHGRGKPQ